MTKVLIVYGGWEGHDPQGVSRLLESELQQHSIEVTCTDDLQVLKELDLQSYDVLIPVWTMETIDSELLHPLINAVHNGLGIVGIHGIIDSFRHEAEFHLMLGGQWVTHFEFAS